MSDTLKARMRAGQTTLGVWLNSCDPVIAEICGGAGYDFAMIDMEHGPGSYRDALTLMQALAGKNCPPLVRVPFSHRAEVKRALDIGAVGVMCPAISTAEHAREMAAACRYAPRGVRGMAATIVRATDYGRNWQDYVARTDDEVVTICQIETREGVENIEAIAAVDGVDLLFIGPFDLSATMGFLGQPDHPEVKAAIAKVEQAVRKAGKMLGSIQTPERPAKALMEQGYSMIIPHADLVLLREAARSALAGLKG